MELLSTKNWKDYELIDCGDFEKLERFGKCITIRPEPQAVWPKIYSNADWEKQATVKFIPKSSSSGEWKKLKQANDRWEVKYDLRGTKDEVKTLVFRLGLTSFKHVGIFPEQAVNWETIYNYLSEINKPKFLNLFAYTGGASIAARAAGADVTHVPVQYKI